MWDSSLKKGIFLFPRALYCLVSNELVCIQVYDTIGCIRFNLQGKKEAMSEKPLPDLKTFIENVNKKDKLNGKKVRFGFTKRKRK